MVVQFAHILQQDLFPVLQTVTGPLSRQMELLISVMSSIRAECLAKGKFRPAP
jgi:hypothetical protein